MHYVRALFARDKRLSVVYAIFAKISVIFARVHVEKFVCFLYLYLARRACAPESVSVLLLLFAFENYTNTKRIRWFILYIRTYLQILKKYIYSRKKNVSIGNTPVSYVSLVLARCRPLTVNL